MSSDENPANIKKNHAKQFYKETKMKMKLIRTHWTYNKKTLIDNINGGQ
jgi:hypothetical protein